MAISCIIFVLKMKIFTVKTNEIAFFALLDMPLLQRSTTSHQLMLTSSAVATIKATWLSLRNLAPGVASGYASGQIKICIFPQ
ncbi:hypothetical protein T02_10237, partial [Trichinella nativa]